ncbi:hypothetical protein KAK06_13735 [Ideonella sp. 4Y11]|uniref:Uncharacterized protein n=1 Tax=Ideonella aquatica TaxID=2824119 RepID=A0A940YVH2_9BURK|nr:hypothetical protein [Ideonella aquatica]MBQ0960010.1 hypothetical protein [Ideonella aquatica]
MSISSIHSGRTALIPTDSDRVKPGRQQAREALGAALASGDLEAARTAFTTLSDASAEGRVRRPDGPFAQLQAALAAGDMQAAGNAFQKLVEKRQSHGSEATNNRPLAQEGTLGRHIDLSA